MNASSSRITSPHSRKRGQTLDGKWTVGEVVGRGGTATVFEGMGPNRERVAIKILHPQLAHDASHRERFQLEADLLARLAHPAFTKVFDNGLTADGLPYLVMELLDGRPVLDPDHGNQKLPLAEVVRIITTVLEALREMHSLGAVHRDIKPGNLHISRDGRVRVIDLGIARSSVGEALTMTGMSIGTPGFMAPEQAMSTRDNIGPSTDIFAVGATAIVLLHGSHVRLGTPMLEAATCAFPSTAALGIEGPRDILAVFDRAVRYAPEDRFARAQDMLEALGRAGVGVPQADVGDVPIAGLSSSSVLPFVDEPTLTIATPATLSLRAARTGKGATEPVPAIAAAPAPTSPKVPLPPALPRLAPFTPRTTSRPPPLPPSAHAATRRSIGSRPGGEEVDLVEAWGRAAAAAAVERAPVPAPALELAASGGASWALGIHPAMTEATCRDAMRATPAAVARQDMLARFAQWLAYALESVVVRLRAWSASRQGA